MIASCAVTQFIDDVDLCNKIISETKQNICNFKEMHQELTSFISAKLLHYTELNLSIEGIESNIIVSYI